MLCLDFLKKQTEMYKSSKNISSDDKPFDKIDLG